MHVELANLTDGYEKLVRRVRAFGHRVTVRGLETREVLDASVTLPLDAPVLPLGTGRGVNKAIAAVEALQLIGGVATPDLVLRIAPQFAAFQDDGRFHGAYGLRVRTKSLEHVITELQADAHSRRAVVNLWDNTIDHEVGLHDYPCTLTLAFTIRERRLHMFTSMRSNDVWLGVPYDFFQFTQLGLTVARVLDVEPGLYHHSAHSMHLYETDFNKVDGLRPAQFITSYPAGVPARVGHWRDAADEARWLLDGSGTTIGTDSTRWYQRALEPHLQAAEAVSA